MSDRDWVRVDQDWLLERPDWAPAWVPAVGRDGDPGPGLRWLRVAVIALLVVGVGSCVAKGADGPADPALGLLCAPGNSVEAGVIATDDAAIETDPSDLIEVFGTIRVTVHPAGADDRDLCVLHATTPEQRSRGLMHVTDLGGLDGMLFSYDADTESNFYMFNTPMPLTIYWWAGDGTIAGGTNMEPCLIEQPGDCPLYGPNRPYRHALEVPKDALVDLGIDSAATITVHPYG